MMKAEIKGDNLVITIPLDKTGVKSKTGKTRVHASTHGNIATSVLVNDQPLTIGLNAYTRALQPA